MNHELLLKNIARFVILTKAEEDYLISKLKTKKLRKRQYFLQEGDVCKYQGFVIKGCLRSYEIDAKGIEHIVQFCPEDWWISDIYSFYTEEPSKNNIDALEDTELLIFDKNSLEDLYKEIPKLERYFRLLMQNSLISLSRRVLSSMSKSATERYCDFIERYPQIEQRVPNHQIASYLGIKPESLSRIRRKYIGK
ncbi:MAG: hypothetical protein RJA25_1457 [Bacteroidota bacterium]|jgi:CRP-like cAMP-binding protein